MDFIFDHKEPTNEAQLEKCRRTSTWLKVTGLGDLVMV